MLVLIVKFVLLIISCTYAEPPCPGTCNCRQYPRDTSDITNLKNINNHNNNNDDNLIFIKVTCTGNVREKLPESTEVLLLRNMLESDLKTFLTTLNGNLKDITVTDVNLTNSSSLSSSSSSFIFNLTAINQLKSLKLSKCGLVSSPTFIITNLTKIQSLDLSYNQLNTFKIQSIETLEVLNLSANAIYTLNANSFIGLISLKSLDLTENMLSTIDDKVLKPLISLQHLNLSRNRLEILNEASFTSLLHLQQLDVSWNRLAKVAPGSLQLPSLARLLLAGNPNLGNFQQPALLVGTGRRLQTVDASRTGLKQVPAALTHSIRTLRLAGNSITVVNCGDLDSYPLLQLLDFTSNNLENIEDDALGRLDSLYVLYLTDNKLRCIPKSLPERLRVLHLEKNKIEQIRNVDLQGLPLLEVLLLSDNKIKVVEEYSFIQLISLETLDLSTNPINILKAGVFSGPTQLRVLRLSRIEAIPPAKEMTFPLSSPEHLVILDLSQSPGLARQLLADTAVLAASHELQELDLSDSYISHIRSDLLHFLPQLRIFRLHGNPLNCTNLQWLALWMRKQDDLEYRNVMCTTPQELWGTLLVDLLEEEEDHDDDHDDDDDEEEKRGKYDDGKKSDSFITESIINQNVTNVVSYDIIQGRNKVTTTNVDGITTTTAVYNTSGNETSIKLSEMKDDETSTANYTTRTTQMLLNHRHLINVTNNNDDDDDDNLSKINKEKLSKNDNNNDDDDHDAVDNEDNSKFLNVNNNESTLTNNNVNGTKIYHRHNNNLNEIFKKNNLTNSIMNDKIKIFKNSTKNANKYDKNELNQTFIIQNNNNSNSNNLKKELLNKNITNLWKKSYKLFSQINIKNLTTTTTTAAPTTISTMNESISQYNKSNSVKDYKKIINKENSSDVLRLNNNNNKSFTINVETLFKESNADLNQKLNVNRIINLNEERVDNILTINNNNNDDNKKDDIYDEINVNVTTSNGKTSMYSSVENRQLNDDDKFNHPGMLILIVGIIIGTVALITVTSRFSWLRTKTNYNNNTNLSKCNSLENVEVSSIRSVTELW